MRLLPALLLVASGCQLYFDGDDDDVDQRQRDQHLPGERHQLVDAKARPGAPQPDQPEVEEVDLADEDDPRRDVVLEAEQRVTAEEQARHDARHRQRVDQLHGVKQAELHA